ncbi:MULTISPECIES: nuclear transport factor 2 family protein [Chryseobacterium]|uniref:Ketosteroid isomerase-like protein n=1 Tax=Chryseobacterium camelliae TaxID=1265445 RepID=A0ABU0TIN7_9FLAO|nr:MULTISPECIES: nuclear transport factor 2 family protein [Chryseobacterium]MDT3409216.1 ketosteroid isomerase-like protein [Pseudacidovorax intermedius]MDQ1096922.1 ketosteroid isomerase-like protein [Chryseobacterium camelliae]MDQ1100864.1 ketosteroid isomerase-like protein [Chryseobacterium sp. SORGH_AS_1048]MDR6084306.1 ketosteroid isomerase-like protein [Chryseobacterium sp. SORGH_AS_0909]MDR6132577.1 ketosteroid isomerase-like protein [Chryseobacterium sp. SORGH_AS_1175]
MMENIRNIADEFNSNYEKLWNAFDFDSLSNLYSEHSILVGYEIVQDRGNIIKSLEQIVDQGWTTIKIQTQLVSSVDPDTILVANIYEAFNSKNTEQQSMKTKSSHVLKRIGDAWQTVMHSAFQNPGYSYMLLSSQYFQIFHVYGF